MRVSQRVGAMLPGLVLATAAQAPPVVPQVHAATLSGAAVDLPRGLQGPAAVLVLGFSQASRDQVAAWGRRLAQDYRDSHDVAYYEIAELESVPRPLRGWVQRKVAGAVPERARAHFFILSDHEAEWKKISNFADAGQAYVLLIDRSGTLRFRTQGLASDTAYAALKGQADALAAR